MVIYDFAKIVMFRSIFLFGVVFNNMRYEFEMTKWINDDGVGNRYQQYRMSADYRLISFDENCIHFCRTDPPFESSEFCPAICFFIVLSFRTQVVGAGEE